MQTAVGVVVVLREIGTLFFPGLLVIALRQKFLVAQALEAVITGLKDQGYELVPVSQLIIKENFHMDQTGCQIAD